MQYVGLINHPILENLVKISLLDKNIETKHEEYFNKPISNHQIDTSIYIKDLNNIVSKLDQNILKKYQIEFSNIREIFIDYTIPSMSKINKVMEKIEDKPYVAENRLIFLVFYGPYSNDVFEVVESKLQESDIKFKSNIVFIDIKELFALFGVIQNNISKLLKIEEIINWAIKMDDDKLIELIDLYDEALEVLIGSSNYANS